MSWGMRLKYQWALMHNFLLFTSTWTPFFYNCSVLSCSFCRGNIFLPDKGWRRELRFVQFNDKGCSLRDPVIWSRTPVPYLLIRINSMWDQVHEIGPGYKYLQLGFSHVDIWPKIKWSNMRIFGYLPGQSLWGGQWLYKRILDQIDRCAVGYPWGLFVWRTQI